jgi:hypothetical protein
MGESKSFDILQGFHVFFHILQKYGDELLFQAKIDVYPTFATLPAAVCESDWVCWEYSNVSFIGQIAGVNTCSAWLSKVYRAG